MSCGRGTEELCRCSVDEDTPLSLAVIECVSEADDDDPEDRPPLYEAIDPEALNKLFQGRNGGEITFTYLDYEITVNNNAVVTSRLLENQPVGAD